MIIHTRTTWDIETGQRLEDEFFEYYGKLARADRAAVGAAKTAGATAASTEAGLGSSAAGIGSNLTPFLTREMTNPQGYSQNDNSAMLTATEAGAGGANSGIAGDAALATARQRNPAGFTGALDDAARTRQKALAASSEGIAANNAGLKQTQQQAGAEGLSKLYNTDTSGMLNAASNRTADINAQTEAGKSGWMQNATALLAALGQGAQGGAAMKTAFKP